MKNAMSYSTLPRFMKVIVVVLVIAAILGLIVPNLVISHSFIHSFPITITNLVHGMVAKPALFYSMPYMLHLYLSFMLLTGFPVVCVISLIFTIKMANSPNNSALDKFKFLSAILSPVIFLCVVRSVSLLCLSYV